MDFVLDLQAMSAPEVDAPEHGKYSHLSLYRGCHGGWGSGLSLLLCTAE